MSKEVRRVLFAAAGALALALGLGGCKDAWRILTTGDLYWDDNGKKEYAFRYDSSGGELYDGTPEGNIAEGTTVTLPSSGGREGYTLAGFTLSGATEGGFNPGDTFTMPAGEVTAKAEWTAVVVVVRNLINLGDPRASTGAGWSYNEASGVFTISGGAGVEVRGSTTGNRVVVRGTAEITLSGAHIDLSPNDTPGDAEPDALIPLALAQGANVTLRLSGTNTLKAGYGSAGVHVPSGRTLTITSAAGEGQTSGRLDVTGGGFCAAVGGGLSESGGVITISGGTVTATGGIEGAGIGGGDYGSGGTISITGGSVTAAATYMAAGIGGGGDGSGGNITITGGTVTANGGQYGAGIGGGVNGGGGTIRINSPGTSRGTATGSGGYGGRSVGPGAAGSGGSFSGPAGQSGFDADGFPAGYDTYSW
ncbi:MAG: S-layer family protein [Treponematales bacterium]